MRIRRWPAIVVAMLVLAALAPLVTSPRLQPALAQTESDRSIQPTRDLITAVQLAAGTPDQPDASLIVRITIEQAEWAYGTATQPATAEDTPPVTRFFLGRLTPAGWEIAFRFTDAFAPLLAESPPDFPSPAIRASLDGFTVAGDGSSQLSFPFPAGQTWTFYGPHPPVGVSVRDALDFVPFTGSSLNAPVLAMRGGIAYRPCENMLIIDHGDGWQTGYYHLINIPVLDGVPVTRGQRVGGTSSEHNCGGFANGDHVHVWLSWQGGLTPIAGHDIGGWTVEDGQSPYSGCLVRGAIRRCTDDGTNYVTNDGDIGSGSGPLASLATNIGEVGDEISYTLDAFPANQTVTVTWRRGGGSIVPLGTVTTDAAGDATGTFAIPATTGGTANTVRFAVGALTRAINVRVLPSLKLNTDAARPGDTVTLALTGFSKQTPVAVSYYPPESTEPIPIGTPTTNNTGGATISLTLPEETPVGVVIFLATAGAIGEESASASIFVANGPTLRIVRLPLRPGQVFDYETYLFPADTTFALDIAGENGDTITTFPDVTTDARGTLSAEATLPPMPHGAYTFRAVAGGTEIATAVAEVSPILSVPAGSYERGSAVAVAGLGFTPGSTVTFAWLPGSTPIELGSAIAGDDGTATMTITVPPAPDGWITLRANDGDADGFAGLLVEGGPPLGPPSVSLAPGRTTVNTWVTYTLTNLPPHSEVTIAWRRVSGGTIDMGSVWTDGLGQATGRIRVPAATGGAQSIRFTAGDVQVTTPFEIVPRIKVTPSPAERGSTVGISLRGYGKQEVVRIRWKQGTTWVELARVTTSNTGSANVRITVPAWAPDGANSVRGDGAQFRAQTNAVQISGGAFNPASVAETPTATPIATPTMTATATPGETATPEPTATQPAEPSPTETVPPEPTETPTPLPTEEPSVEPTATVTDTPPDEPVPTDAP